MITATHEGTGITASAEVWRSYEAGVYADGTVERMSSGEVELLLLGMQATGSTGDAAVIWAMGERNRRREARTAATAQARLADALTSVAQAVGAESAEAFVRRLPERIRPYAEAVLSRP